MPLNAFRSIRFATTSAAALSLPSRIEPSVADSDTSVVSVVAVRVDVTVPTRRSPVTSVTRNAAVASPESLPLVEPKKVESRRSLSMWFDSEPTEPSCACRLMSTPTTSAGSVAAVWSAGSPSTMLPCGDVSVTVERRERTRATRMSPSVSVASTNPSVSMSIQPVPVSNRSMYARIATRGRNMLTVAACVTTTFPKATSDALGVPAGTLASRDFGLPGSYA